MKKVIKNKVLSEKNYRSNIIDMLKKDIKDTILNISKEEIEHISKNIYMFCYLKVMGADNFEISRHLLYRNNKFYELREAQGRISNNSTHIDIQLYKDLSKKYIKILQARLVK